MKSKGFTLIELLVAVMIVGILSAVAVSSYQDYITRANRADAKAVLMEVAGWMERNYSAKGCYHQLVSSANDCSVATATVTVPIGQSPKTGTAKYNITLPTLTATTFTAQAASPEGGWSDAECGTLTLNHLGQQGASGEADTVAEIADCWQR